MMHDAEQSGKNRHFNISILSQAIAFATAISGSAYAAEIEEVVVTAQKRAENLQDVPISISAVTGDNIKAMGVKNLTDLGKSTPGVEMNNDTPLQPTYNIRGIQTSDFTVGSDPAVAVYVDGVYNGRGAGAEVPLADIDRVEVLKGPQGTLFGRNATGGAIHIITKKPQADDTTELSVTAGNYGRISSDLLLNRQLSDTVFARLTASSNKRDSHTGNLADGPDSGDQNTQTYRAALLWEASPNTEVLWRADYGVMDQGSAVRTSIVPSLQEMDGGTDVFGDYSLDTPTIEERDSFGTSLTVTHDFDTFTFTSISAYSKFDAYLQQDEDGTSLPDYMFGSANFDDQEQFSQEFRLNGASDTLKWTLGASYSQEKVKHQTDAYFTAGSLESFAVYEGVKAAYEGAGFTTTELEEIAVQTRQGMIQGNMEGAAVSTFVYDLMLQSGQVDQLLTMFGAPDYINGSMLNRDDMAAQLMAGIAPWVMADTPWNETVHNEGDYRSAAVYGDFTWSLTDRMDLTIGARYTADDKDFNIVSSYQNTLPLALAGGGVRLMDESGNVIDTITLPTLPLGTIPAPRFGMAFNNNGIADLNQPLSDSWSDVSGRVVLDYRWNDDVMTYVSLADGFKAGGFNSFSAAPGIDPSFDQEDVVNMEAGLKSNLFNNSLQFNAAVYSYEYDNLQELSLVGQPIPNYYLRNADAEGQGLELELLWAATDNLLLGGNFSHLKTEYTRYQVLEAAGETEEDSRLGEARVGTPENKFNLMGEYNVDLSSGANLVFRADYNWTDERVGTVTDPERVVDDYQLLNLRAGWSSASDRYSAALWVQNATDEEIAGGYGGTGAAIGASPAWRYMPRMYGADFTVRF